MKLSLKSKSILIVEDYGSMRKALRDMLYSLGADNIAEAESAAVAINAMIKNSFDLVLCDYNLGVGKNAQQLLEEARYRKLIDHKCVFIIISAEHAASLVLGAMDSKPDEFLAKPFNAQQLAARLQRNFAQKEYMAGVEKEIWRGNLAKAIQVCDRLLATGDKKMRIHLLRRRAELAINTGDYATALKTYRDILADRELPWAKLGLGIIEYQQNRIEAAIAVFEQLVQEHPLMMEAYDWLSTSYESLNKLHDVEHVLYKAVDLSPQSILRQKKLAVTADKNDSLDVAENAYRATVQLGKYSIYRSCGDFAGLAKLYSRINASDKALKTLQAMRSEFFNNPEAELRAVTLEVELYKKKGEDEPAALAMQKLLSLSSSMGGKIPKDLQLDIARACFLSDQHEKAEQILSGLIKTHIDDEAFLNDVRRMQTGIGRDNYSEILIQKTKKMLIAANNKGVALYNQGKLKEALELFENAIASMPDNKTIIYNMLKILVHDLKIGDYSEGKMTRAKQLFKKAMQIGIDPHKLGILKTEFAEVSHKHLSLG